MIIVCMRKYCDIIILNYSMTCFKIICSIAILCFISDPFTKLFLFLQNIKFTWRSTKLQLLKKYWDLFAVLREVPGVPSNNYSIPDFIAKGTKFQFYFYFGCVLFWVFTTLKMHQTKTKKVEAILYLNVQQNSFNLLPPFSKQMSMTFFVNIELNCVLIE